MATRGWRISSISVAVSLCRCVAVSLCRCVAVTLSLCRFFYRRHHFVTVAFSLSLCRNDCLDSSVSPSLSRYHCDAVTLSLSPCRCVAVTVAHVTFAVTVSPSLCRRRAVTFDLYIAGWNQLAPHQSSRLSVLAGDADLDGNKNPVEFDPV